MDGKIKVTATGRYRYTSHVLSVKSFAQYLRMQLKNDFFLHLFNIGQPCKQYNFQTCLRYNLVPRMLEMAFQSFQISKVSGGACTQTHLGYRPITILPALSKIIEKAVHMQLYTFLKENKPCP